MTNSFILCRLARNKIGVILPYNRKNNNNNCFWFDKMVSNSTCRASGSTSKRPKCSVR